MCRWFAYLGQEPQLLEDVLLRPRHSLIKQVDKHFLPAEHVSFSPDRDARAQGSHADAAQVMTTPSAADDAGSSNTLTNMDGFGVGWWTTSSCDFKAHAGDFDKPADALRPVIYHSIRPPLNDRVLASLAQGTSTPAIVAHIRAGAGLTPVVETNCHPFTFGRHLFAHNGVLGSFHLFKVDLLAELPVRYQEAILGTTDSEHMAAMYFFHLCGLDGSWQKLYPAEEMATAMEKTVSALRRLKSAAEERLKSSSQGKGNQDFAPAPTTLNLVASSGSSLVAIRYSEHQEAPSLYYSTVAGATINCKFKGHPNDEMDNSAAGSGLDKRQHRAHIIVASEPTTLNAKEWDLLREGRMIVVDEDLRYHLR